MICALHMQQMTFTVARLCLTTKPMSGLYHVHHVGRGLHQFTKSSLMIKAMLNSRIFVHMRKSVKYKVTPHGPISLNIFSYQYSKSMLISFLTNHNQSWKNCYQICTTVDACVKTVPISEPKIRKKHAFFPRICIMISKTSLEWAQDKPLNHIRTKNYERCYIWACNPRCHQGT